MSPSANFNECGMDECFEIAGKMLAQIRALRGVSLWMRGRLEITKKHVLETNSAPNLVNLRHFRNGEAAAMSEASIITRNRIKDLQNKLRGFYGVGDGWRL